MSRHTVRLPLLIAIVLLLPALASAQQSFQVNVGYFAPKGEDSRVDGDALLANLAYHTFDLGDLGNVTVGGEWLFPVGNYLEGGVGVSYFSRSIPSVYTDYVNDNGSEIEQDFKLRIIPISATIRFLPLGRGARVEPYIGAGVGVFAWRYTETGDFIDDNGDIFPDRFQEKGTEVGPLVFGGVRLPMTHNFSVGGEVRYQRAEGELDASLFNGDRIDLGGLTWQAVLQFKF